MGKLNIESPTVGIFTLAVIALFIGFTQINDVAASLPDKSAEFLEAVRRPSTKVKDIASLLEPKKPYFSSQIKILPANIDAKDKGDNTALMYAIGAGNDEIALHLLQKNAKVDTANRYGFTALMIAAKKGNLLLVKELLIRGADANQVSAVRKFNALQMAIEGNRFDVAKELIDASENAASFLEWASYREDTDFMTKLILKDQKKIDLETKDQLGNTLLMKMVQANKMISLKNLLDFKANPNAINNKGEAPLCHAMENHLYHVALSLIQAAANPNVRCSDQRTPLMWAADDNQLDMVSNLLTAGADPNILTLDPKSKVKSALDYAIHNRNRMTSLSIVEKLLPVTIDFKGHKKSKWHEEKYFRLFQHALRLGKLSIVKDLIQRNPTLASVVLEKTAYGPEITPLGVASELGHDSLVDFLVPLEKDPMKIYVAFALAAEMNKFDSLISILREIKKRGENLDEFIFDNGPLLCLDMTLKNPAFLTKLLVELKLDPNIRCPTNYEDQDKNGLTPFIIASTSGLHESAKLFLSSDSDPNMTDLLGNSALHFSANYGRHSSLTFLLENTKINPLATNKEGFTPLAIALYANQRRSAQILWNFESFKKSATSFMDLNILRHTMNEMRLKISQQDKDSIRALAQQYMDRTLEKLARYNPRPSKIPDNCIKNPGAELEGEVNQLATPALAIVCSSCKIDERPKDFPIGTGAGPASCDCFICKDCVPDFLNHEIKDNGNQLGKCPGCSQVLHHEYFKSMGAESDTVERFRKKQITHKILEKFPSFKFCPTPGCFSGNMIDKKVPLKCDVCQFNGCIQCKEDHTGSCDDYFKGKMKMAQMLELGKLPPPAGGHPRIKDADPSNPAHADYFKGRFRPCPKCQTPIEKVFNGQKEHGQCNEMKCGNPACRVKFDWNSGLKNNGNIWASEEMRY